MMSRQHTWILRSELWASWLVLLAMLYYTYLDLIKAPYIGFNYNAATGQIIALHLPNPKANLQAGDLLIQVNGLTFAEWHSDLAAELFPAAAPGDTLQLALERNGQRFEVLWPVPGFNWREFNDRVFNIWWIGYLFWLGGLMTLLLVRPLDSKRSLFAAFFFLAALWLVIGNTSRWGHGDSRIIYRAALCLSVPVLLHLHWLFPRPLGHLPAWLLWGFYGAAVVAALLHWTPLISPDFAVLAFGLSLLGSLGLLFAHYLRQPEERAHVRLLLYALLFAILPLVALTASVAFDTYSTFASYALLALPIIPGAYFYSIYRFQLGGSELRANRMIAVYLYLIALGTLLLILASILSASPGFEESAVLWSTLFGLVAAVVTLYAFPPFQRLIERRLLAMPLPPVQLIDTYLARITTTLNEASLVELLKNEVLPSLLIRESALLRIQNNDAIPIYLAGEELPPEVIEGIVAHLDKDGVYRVTAAPTLPALKWIRLALALQVEGRLIGVWLLGRHDPDDQYSPEEVATLQTLARQTTLALANIEQAAQLQALYQANIERQEMERMKMAHFLHDAILNQAAVLYMSLDAAALSPRIESAYETLKAQIRQMISNLRPPSLDLGLGAALEEMAEELDQRTQSRFALHLTAPAAELHYPPHIENHIFRIVQQACENAVRHARAGCIQITGTLAPDYIDLTIEDDGVGFVVGKPLDMTYLLAHKHFGLVHMMERAEHIHAELALESEPGQGTRVHVRWSANHQQDGYPHYSDQD